MAPCPDPVAKISIVPRGPAGGLTFFAPSEQRLESGLYSRSYLENQMAVALGGRIAEELMFGEAGITTGASNDFQQVTRTAHPERHAPEGSNEVPPKCRADVSPKRHSRSCWNG